MRISITGSKVHRVWKCPPSAILPQIDSDDDPSARQRGAKIHAYLERVSQVGVEAALEEISDSEILPVLRAIDTAALPTSLASEVAFAWNWRTKQARELGRHLGRNYVSVGTDEIACTLDLIGVNEALHFGYVGDYKSGHVKLPPPNRYGQLLLGALCVRELFHCDDVVVELLHLHGDGDHHRARATVDAWDLDLFAHELAEAMAAVDRWEAEYAAGRSVAAHEGPHCDYCPAFNACPAKVALVRALPDELIAFGVRPEPDDKGELVLASGAITVARAAKAWMAIERISHVLDRAKQEICGMAAMGDIPLPDGRVLGKITTERRAVDGRIGAEVLEERYGRETRDQYVELKLSISAIQLAVTKNLKQGQRVSTKAGDGQLDRVLSEIERRGGLAVNTTESVKPHTPRKRAG